MAEGGGRMSSLADSQKHAIDGPLDLDDDDVSPNDIDALSISSTAKNYILVAAIDFGTTFSGYAFSFKSEKGDIIMFKDWGAGVGLTGYKAPTAVLTDRRGMFQAFGYEAQKQYADLTEDESHELCYYEKFKMLLHREKNLSLNTMITAKNGKKRPAIDIFVMTLSFLRDHLIETVTKQVKKPPSNDYIRWVITVPAIWSDAAKQFMRESALRAGLISDVNSEHLLIALEPEAASIYCRNLPVDQFVQSSSSGESREGAEGGGDDSATALKMTANTKYIVLDCGGGTLDVTCHQLTNRLNMSEIYQANGGDLGGALVDHNFVSLLCNLYSSDVVNKYQKECPAGWLDLMCTFESKKKDVRTGEGSLNLRLPYDMAEIYQELKHKSFKKAIPEDYQLKGVKFSNGVLVIPYSVVMEVFSPVTDKIIQHIKELLLNPVLHNISHIMMVGGFSQCLVLQEDVRSNFGDEYNILVPNEASLCVIKGAVAFGHNPEIVTSRIVRRTYGIEICDTFDPRLHDVKYKRRVDRADRCMKLFRPLVKCGEKIKIGQVTHFLSGQLFDEWDQVDVTVYSTEKTDVTYVDESGVSYHASVKVKVPIGHVENKRVEVLLRFGGTELIIKAKDMSARSNGVFAETSVQFLCD